MDPACYPPYQGRSALGTFDGRMPQEPSALSCIIQTDGVTFPALTDRLGIPLLYYLGIDG